MRSRWRRLTRPALLLVLGALLGMLRAAEFFADGFFQQHVTVNTLVEIFVLGAFGSATMLLSLAVWLTVNPARPEDRSAPTAPPSRPRARTSA